MTCLECKGTGWVELFTSRERCKCAAGDLVEVTCTKAIDGVWSIGAWELAEDDSIIAPGATTDSRQHRPL